MKNISIFCLVAAVACATGFAAGIAWTVDFLQRPGVVFPFLPLALTFAMGALAVLLAAVFRFLKSL